jgi:hypothetical protein
MPSFVTLLIVQCHHVRGRAAAGGDLKPSASGSGDWARAAAVNNRRKSAEREIFMGKYFEQEPGNPEN